MPGNLLRVSARRMSIVDSFPAGASQSIRIGIWIGCHRESVSDIFFGAGLEFSFNDRFALRGVWDAYELSDVDVDYYGLEADFRF